MVIKSTIIERDDLNHPFFYAKVLEAKKKNKRKVARENSRSSNKKITLIEMHQNMRD